MKAIQLEKTYDPKDFEDRIYALWEQKGCFKPVSDHGAIVEVQVPYTISIPPPNVTGVLHMGHCLNNTLQDIAIRYHRMKGDNTLWVPGTDHAGIATQNVVERRLKAEGLTRDDLGREKFIARTWEVKKEHHSIIVQQQRKIGNSVDWERERFTMDEGLSKAVREVFVTLYERGLVYRGNYLVNWCPSCGTALADDEVEHEDTPGAMYHIRYDFADSDVTLKGKHYIEIATTRPETLLGDTAVAVHPEDPRYTALIGKKVKLPLTDRTIPIIADSYVDREFGTGMVKITPAHDPNDYAIAGRHNLEIINILAPNGTLNDAVPTKYRAMTVADARAAVLADLEAAELYVGKDDMVHPVGHCYRCHTVVEPYLSEQWFVKMRPLADKALAAWRKGEVIFYPKKWENTYSHWLENIRDWCISRQLWWGHRIPVWYCAECGEVIVSRDDPQKCPQCGAGAEKLRQDPDVLDTWFSSWLWPFSTLGWPEQTPDLAAFYPTTALVTAYDIIFFWVSRMIMAGLEFTGKAPFRDVYIHGLVRDRQGRKMSKSLGNGLDPLVLVDQYGSDALKFTLGFLAAQGQDILVDADSFKLGSRFANKIWNASRYILGNLEGRTIVKNAVLTPLDKWIYSRLNATAGLVRTAIEGYRYNEAAQALYDYFWGDFCDWYVEATKLSFRGEDDSEKDRAATVLLQVLEESLRLLHPYLPFVTEEIYGKLPPEVKTAELLISAPYPAPTVEREYSVEAADFAVLQDLVRAARALRTDCGIDPAAKVKVTVVAAASPLSIGQAAVFCLLANASEVDAAAVKPKNALGASCGDYEVFIHTGAGVDPTVLVTRFEKERVGETAFADKLAAKLAGSFAEKAPPEVVAQEREKLEKARAHGEKLADYIASLKGGT